MHIKEIEIKNVRAIRELKIVFDQPAGWHVLLGENGAGKSSLIRSISAALVGPTEILRLDPDFSTWVTQGETEAVINLLIARDIFHDKRSGQGGAKGGVKDSVEIRCNTLITSNGDESRPIWQFLDNTGIRQKKDDSLKRDGLHPDYYHWGSGSGWFSAAFGPYRRFTGGDSSLESFYIRNPKIGAHLTAFKENAALTESIVWLKDQLLRSLSGGKDESKIIDSIKKFISQADLLPEGYALADITANGPFFSIPSGGTVHLYELSEGIKSVTSLAFELIRLLLRVYSVDEVLSNYTDTDPLNNYVPVPGVVLIDEMDVHLHPTWQSRIGRWFTRNFPNIQFIVTTHSAFVCRGATSVWRLYRSPETTGTIVSQIPDDQLQRLLYGDILDAYGTGFFGDVTRDESANNDIEHLAALNLRFYRDELTPSEAAERETLLTRFPEHGTLLAS